MQELFLNSEASVQSDRILYTPSLFARSALLNLQEVGSLKARSPHTSTRSGLTSYLYFLVLDGEGSLTYEGRQYQLKQGDCVFMIVKTIQSQYIRKFMVTCMVPFLWNKYDGNL